jgi:predicted ATP-grasp superfamily ATP-dependent carboligase
MGCRVDVVCPSQHPVTKTRAIRRVYAYRAFWPLASLRAAIESSAPDMIIPCDDDAAMHLQRLSAVKGAAGTTAQALRTLIERSLGTPDACALALTRGRLLAAARSEGVRIPKTAEVATLAELDELLMQHRYPVVLKRDFSCGGQGTAIVGSSEEARVAFIRMTSRPSIVKAVARMFLDREPSVFLNSWQSTRRAVSLQEFIPGRAANRAVACWRGEVVAGISVEAITTQHATGPATVVRVIDNQEMTDAVSNLVRRMGISGLWGVDFVLEATSGHAYAIEMNPRATSICHIPLGAGRNLPAALYTQLTGIAPAAQPARVDRDIIAIFPGEWRRDPTSSHLHSAYHDIPWDEPEFVRQCIGKAWHERGLLARLWAVLHSKPTPLVVADSASQSPQAPVALRTGPTSSQRAAVAQSDSGPTPPRFPPARVDPADVAPAAI